MHVFFCSVFLCHLCESYFHYFLLNFQCWCVLVFGSCLPQFPTLDFSKALKPLLLMHVASHYWYCPGVEAPAHLLVTEESSMEISQASSSELCMGSLWSLAVSASLALVFSLPLVWSVLFMKLFIFHNGCTLKTTWLLNVSRGFLFMNDLIPFCRAQIVPVSHGSFSSLCKSMLICLLSKQAHSRRIFQFT